MIKDLTPQQCTRLLENKYIGRLAYIDGKLPFVAPITYYYDPEGNSIVSYSLEGHKIDAMRDNRYVSLQVDDIVSVTEWKSVLVHGEFEELRQIDAKNMLHRFAQGVKELINQNPDKDVRYIHEFSSKMQAMGDSPITYRINIHEITGKQRSA